MESIKCINLVNIGHAVMGIQGAKNNKLVVPVNNALVCSTSILAADTWALSWCLIIYTMGAYATSDIAIAGNRVWSHKISMDG